MCLRLNLGDPVPKVVLLQFLDFTGAYCDQYHHQREEKYLFPALAATGIDEDSALGFLREEHAVERRLLRDLDAAVSSFSPHDDSSVQQVVETCQRYTRHMIGHMQKEDSLLFRIAEDLLDDGAKQYLIQALGADDHGAHERYERLAEELETRWAV
jgi:hemerythrin-like domain-containing protein